MTDWSASHRKPSWSRPSTPPGAGASRATAKSRSAGPRTRQKAKQTALEWFPNIALPGDLSQELAQPAHFEQASELLSEDELAEIVACGPDRERHIEMIGRFSEAGFDHVYIHQIGPDQQGFMDFYAGEVFPRLSEHAEARLQ